MADGLATRCPGCGTVFRVVRDQLRVSEGWVRCGRCANVFNASQALVDLDTGLPRRGAQDAAGDGAATPAAAPAPAPAAGPVQADLHVVDTSAVNAAAPPSTPVPLQAPEADSTAPATEGQARAERPAPPMGDAAAALASATGPAADSRTARVDRTDITPSFLRRADRAARWQRPRVRAALLACSVLATALLAGQVAFEYRDLVAARLPATRPALELACAWLGCRVGAARSIEGLAVESSGLVRVEQSDVYRLTVALRNRSAIALALPALDLSLTDTQGRLLARRVMHAPELGARQETLAAGRELALQATLQTGPDVVAGYTIELFYP